MNDIEILIDNFEQLKRNKFIVDSIDAEFFFKFGENLIKRVKELEKENEILTGARNWYFEHFSAQACTPEQLRKIMEYEYLQKSKVREKIKEIKERREIDGACETALAGFQREAKLDVLQELLEN